jgi:hypothetical protein
VYAKGEAEILIGKAIKVSGGADLAVIGVSRAPGGERWVDPPECITHPLLPFCQTQPVQELGWKRSDIVLST